MKGLLVLVAVSAFLSLPSIANADIYETFAISGTDSQRQQDVTLGESGCGQLICSTYAPGTFSGGATIDITTDTIVAANIATCCNDIYSMSVATTAATPNVGTGLDLVLLTENNTYPTSLQSTVYLDFDLSSDSATGYISGPGGRGSGLDHIADPYALDMLGTLTPQFTTPTAAPEIDPAAALSALMLFASGLTILRSRRQ